MGLFKRQQGPSSSSEDEVPGLAALAASRGWQPIPDAPFGQGLGALITRLNWVLYGRRHTSVYDTGNTFHATAYSDAYGGAVGDRRIVVGNAWTNIGPQDLVKLHEMMGVAVCAVELASLSPIMLVQPRDLPLAERVPTTALGSPDFDRRFAAAMSPGIQAALTPEVQQRILAHDDWAFIGDDNWLACVSRGPFRSSDDVSRRLDELLGVVAALPSSVEPSHIDRSVDDLAVRIRALSSPEEAVAFLQQLSADDRQRLAQSDTPLAAFADVTTLDQAMARFQTLDVPHRMQLLGMFQRAEGGG